MKKRETKVLQKQMGGANTLGVLKTKARKNLTWKRYRQTFFKKKRKWQTCEKAEEQAKKKKLFEKKGNKKKRKEKKSSLGPKARLACAGRARSA